MNDPVLVCDGLAKRYARSSGWVIHDADLALPGGSLATVVGTNGSGKSTLLRLIADVSRPDKGTVRSRPTPVAWVPDRFFVPTAMTVASYLAHMARIRGVPEATARARTGRLLDELRLTPGPETPLNALSQGNAQKVAIAQAFVGPVGLLVLDEAWNALDPSAAATLDGLVAEACARGAVAVASAHGPTVAGASHLFVLRDGRLQEEHEPPAPTRPSDRSPGLVEIRLAPNPGARDFSARRLGTRQDGELVVSVDPQAVGALLVSAVEAGWSVRAVLPHSADDHRSGQ